MPALAASSAAGGPVSKVSGQASGLLHAATACAPSTCSLASLKSQVAELGSIEFRHCFGTACIPGKGQRPRARGGQGSHMAASVSRWVRGSHV